MPARLFPLICHPACPQVPDVAVAFAAARSTSGLVLEYQVTGNVNEIVLPTEIGGARRDELWRTTCFEAFIGIPHETAYREINIAPNGDWAAYRFSAYRSGQVNLDIAPPVSERQLSERQLLLKVFIEGLLPPPPVQIGPAIILESREGERSYWALTHASDTPDFHFAETFQYTLD